MAIRYDKKLNNEINRVIRNFNQKIARLEKQGKELLPTKISKKEIKENAYTRADIKRKLNELKRFSQRDVERVVETKGGVRLTKYELNEIKRENARVKRQLTREINRLKVEKPKIFGKKQASTFSQMGDSDYLNLSARRKALDKNIDVLSKDELTRLTKLIEKTGKNQQYMNGVFKENYYKMLTDLGYYYKYDNSKLDKLKKKLMELKPNDFYKLFKEDKSIRAILDYYPIVTGQIKSMNPDDVREDVTNLYDALIDNIDEILLDYA